MIPLSAPEISGRELEYVTECLKTGWVSSVGEFVNRFERDIERFTGSAHAVACVNGTSGLHVSLVALGVEPGDEILLPSLTFIAPANAVRYAGAVPVFIDVEPRYWQIDPDGVREFLRRCRVKQGCLINPDTGRRVRGIIPVHVLGHPVAMDSIVSLAREYGLFVLEDATESLGAEYMGRHTGTIGDVGVFSFNGNKIITCGGGGMVVTGDALLAERVRYLTTQAKDAGDEYIHREVGYNYRLTNVQAAIGVAQLERLKEFIEKKSQIRARYDEAFADMPDLRAQEIAPQAWSNHWLYTIRVGGSVGPRDLMRALENEGVQSRPLWQPLHRSPAHAFGPHADCPVADDLFHTALSLPSSPGLSQLDQDIVIAAVRKFIHG